MTNIYPMEKVKLTADLHVPSRDGNDIFIPEGSTIRFRDDGIIDYYKIGDLEFELMGNLAQDFIFFIGDFYTNDEARYAWRMAR